MLAKPKKVRSICVNGFCFPTLENKLSTIGECSVTNVKRVIGTLHETLLMKPSCMYILKTENGREIEQNPDIFLKARTRQILGLADGTHSRSSIEDLLEHDIGAELYWLIQSGLVEEQVRMRIVLNHTGLHRESVRHRLTI